MIGYIRQLLDGEDSASIAANAALAYLALVVAFSDRSLLQISWAPCILIEVGEKEFEVSPVDPVKYQIQLLISKQIILDNRQVAGDAVMEPLCSGVSENELGWQAHRPSSKMESFLDSLATRDLSNLVPIQHDYLSLIPGTLIQAGGDTGQDCGTLNGTPALRVINHLAVLQSLDKTALSLSVSINVAYWKLGEAYEVFVNVSIANHCRGVQAALSLRCIVADQNLE
jgi:hypothetical protein